MKLHDCIILDRRSFADLFTPCRKQTGFGIMDDITIYVVNNSQHF